uniref:F-box domain-containing protein n=1 Tax=Panagrellus redivivus TaxID=6233 RepID=A0A7E4ZPY3_PANRE
MTWNRLNFHRPLTSQFFAPASAPPPLSSIVHPKLDFIRLPCQSLPARVLNHRPTSTSPTMLEHLDIRNVTTTNYQFFRRLIENMSVETLRRAHQSNTEIQRYSSFRGDFVEVLKVEVGPEDEDGYITYSNLINRPLKMTPMNHLSIRFGPHTDSKAVLARMDSRIYPNLCIHGHYNWRQVLDLLHPKLDSVNLYDTLELPNDDVPDFFTALFGYLIPLVIMHNDNCNHEWVFRSLHVGLKLKKAMSFNVKESVYWALYFTGTDGVTLELRILDTALGEDSDDENGDDENDDDNDGDLPIDYDAADFVKLRTW